jgi:hypothetical protein
MGGAHTVGLAKQWQFSQEGKYKVRRGCRPVSEHVEPVSEHVEVYKFYTSRTAIISVKQSPSPASNNNAILCNV